jgi:spore coat protein U-like protein
VGSFYLWHLAVRSLVLATPLLLSSSLGAMAATNTASFTVTVTVTATCTIGTTNLAFGAYTGLIDTATSTVTVTCTNTTPYNVGLNAGLASGATVTTRAMQQGALTTPYALYQTAAMTTNWGMTVGSDTVTGTGNGAAQPLTVYGRIAAGLYPNPGAYTDTIIATVTF